MPGLLKPLRFTLPFGFLALTGLGVWIGGVWQLLPIACAPALLCGLDHALGWDRDEQGPEPDHHVACRMLPRLYVGLQIAVLLLGALRVSDRDAGLLDLLGTTVVVGVGVGVFGMLAAHDLIHRRAASDRAIGLAMLACAGYMHFRIAHIHGHHVRAASLEDPATARRGESVYGFFARSVAGQFTEAWRFEAARLRRRREPVIGPSNRMLGYIAIELALGAGFAWLGARPFAFWVGQAALAVFLLEAFNYIAHYGLVRRCDARGVLEPIRAQHSWNCSRRMNNWSMFNMGRHGDHHLRPAGAYETLAPIAGAPELPTGYAGSILLALVPPLWRQVMDPRAAAWTTGRARDRDLRQEWVSAG